MESQLDWDAHRVECGGGRVERGIERRLERRRVERRAGAGARAFAVVQRTSRARPFLAAASVALAAYTHIAARQCGH